MTERAEIEPLSVQGAKDLTEAIRAAVERVWDLLLRAHETRAWELLGYDTWDQYVRREFSISRSASYRLLTQGRVIRALSAAAGAELDVTARRAELVRDDLPSLGEEMRQATAGLDEPERREVAEGIVARRVHQAGVGEAGAQHPLDPDVARELRSMIGSLMIERDNLRAENERLRARVAELEGSPVDPCDHPMIRRIGEYCSACGERVAVVASLG